jgi:hypothetical protein
VPFRTIKSDYIDDGLAIRGINNLADAHDWGAAR